MIKQQESRKYPRRNGQSEKVMAYRVKAALDHPDCPEFMDGFTDTEKEKLAKHIGIRVTITRDNPMQEVEDGD